MKSRTVNLQLLNEDNEIDGHVEFLASDDGKDVVLSCSEGLLGARRYTGVDYFWAFGSMRDDLSALGFRPMCKGAVKHVFPGGMQGDVSMGLIAYILDEEGAGSGSVNIFEAAAVDEIDGIVHFNEHKAYRKSLAQYRRGKRLIE